MSFTEEQSAFRDTVRRMVAKHVAPIAAAIDETDRFPLELVRLFGEMGLMQLWVPEQYGGLGESSVTTGIIIEQIAYADFNASYVPLLASLMGGMLAQHASPDIAQQWLPKVTAGEAIIGLGLTEPPRDTSPAAGPHETGDPHE